jgi:hypothetical protein
MRTRPITFNDKTFQELLSTGAYKLIEDDTIRYALIYYYNNPSVSVWNNTIDGRNNKALHFIVKYAPLKLYFMNDSLFADEIINYAKVKEDLIINLRKEQEFEGLLKNSIRTISELNELEENLLSLNKHLLTRIDSLLNI